MPELDEQKVVTSSNSYADADTADEYLDNTYGANEWADIDADDKDQLLITATVMLDELTLKYDKTASTQALKFPVDSESATDRHGVAIGDGFVEAQKVCILQAYYIYQNHEVMAETRQNKLMGVKATKSGSVLTTVNGGNPNAEFDPAVMGTLANFLDLSCSTVRV